MIGSGVYLLPASLAPYGWDSVGGWGFTIAGVLLLARVFARLTRALPDADGPHGFVLAAFGPLPAFLVGWSYWISNWVGNAALAVAAVSYLSRFAPALATAPVPLAIALVWAVTLINLRGAGLAGRVQLATTILKLLPLVAVIVIGALVAGASHGSALAPFPPHGLTPGGITGAAALTLWAMTGFESASLVTAQIDDAAATIPRVTIVGVTVTGIVYLLACSSIVLLLPAAAAAQSAAPFADFVARFWSARAADAVTLLAAVASIGALGGITLVNGALPVSLARAGSFPRWFAATDTAGTPVRALLVSAVLTTVMLLANTGQATVALFPFMALVSTSATLFLYVGIAAAGLRFGLGRATCALALVFAVWTLWGAGLGPTGWSALLLAAGVPVFAWLRRPGAAQAAP